MTPVDSCGSPGGADVCLVLEGTYPYVRGGVSTWVHEIIRGLPDLRFAVVHVGPQPGAYSGPRYAMPPNVVSFTDLYCRDIPARRRELRAAQRAARSDRRRHRTRRGPSRLLRGLRRLHLEDFGGDPPLDDLASADLSPSAFLHGRASFDLTADLAARLAPDASFVDVFWHVRSMHLPLVRLLGAPPPPAAVYHAVCTGYAGLLAAAWSRRTDRPLLLTEHGIYARERCLELDRAAWLRERTGRGRRGDAPRAMDGPTASALRRMWTHFFLALARCAYARAATIVSICEAGRSRQIADGAPSERTIVVPNGIHVEAFRAPERVAPVRPAVHRTLRVGFVGRLVPIKDLVTLLHACALALQSVKIDVRLFGPTEEDPRYTERCKRLAATLGLESAVRFEAPRPADRIYPELDVLVLTSFSEGQPLVILEAFAAGIPVVATDVGACRELILGRSGADRSIGPAGIVTPLAAPEETAAAIVRLARDPGLGRRMGDSGRRRVTAYYRERATLDAYRALYRGEAWPASAGGWSD